MEQLVVGHIIAIVPDKPGVQRREVGQDNHENQQRAGNGQSRSWI
jgi:hypothetical protein